MGSGSLSFQFIALPVLFRSVSDICCILINKVLDVKPLVPYLSEYANSLTNNAVKSDHPSKIVPFKFYPSTLTTKLTL